MDADAFYTRDGDTFSATPLTRGPWSEVHQHGGPPAALIARAMEALAAADGDWQFARFTIDFLRPLAIGPALHVTAAVTRSGDQAGAGAARRGHRYGHRPARARSRRRGGVRRSFR